SVPTAAQVKALIRSHTEGDEERFYSVALQVAAQAARQGHSRFRVGASRCGRQRAVAKRAGRRSEESPHPEPQIEKRSAGPLRSCSHSEALIDSLSASCDCIAARTA